MRFLFDQTNVFFECFNIRKYYDPGIFFAKSKLTIFVAPLEINIS